MDEPKPLDSLFKEKLFRIPDYQRGYAWGREQLDAFWEDLINLPDGRSHYTGVLTLNEMPSADVQQDEKEFWLVDDHSYKLYHIVDGQQRLTTFTLFLQAFIDLLRSLPANQGQADDAIYLTDTLSIRAVESKFLFEVKPAGEAFRTYKFGYTDDNPSYEYMRYRILGEVGGGTLFETFYTLNLSNGKRYFKEQLRAWHKEEGISGLKALYRTLTKRFLFNEYIIKDEFDVFVAFETMNNRGKTLSDLELLKNRLIYLTTLYTDAELDAAERKDLRNLINDAWKEVYFQLGRNKSKPLNDDDFLRAHWMMYFKFSRQTGRDYIKFLLEEQFTLQRVHRKIVQPVELEEAEEQTSDTDLEADDENGLDEVESSEPMMVAELRPNEIRDYVKSLKASSVHWFRTFYPEMSDDLTWKEIEWIQRLNRLGMAYFRPLLMAILKKCDDPGQRIGTFKEIERFVFVVFRLTQTRSNYRSSEFSNAVRAIDRGDMDLAELKERLRNRMSFTFTDEGHFANETSICCFRRSSRTVRATTTGPACGISSTSTSWSCCPAVARRRSTGRICSRRRRTKSPSSTFIRNPRRWRGSRPSKVSVSKSGRRTAIASGTCCSSLPRSTLRCRTTPSPKRRSPSATAMAVSSATVMQTDRTRKSKSPIAKIGGPMRFASEAFG